MSASDIYPLSLHDALPIFAIATTSAVRLAANEGVAPGAAPTPCVGTDRKSTRLNSSHVSISYAVFCLQKKTGELSLLNLPIDRPRPPVQTYRGASHVIELG